MPWEEEMNREDFLETTIKELEKGHEEKEVTRGSKLTNISIGNIHFNEGNKKKEV